VLTADHLMHPPNYPSKPRDLSGLENLKEVARKLLFAFPDPQYAVEDFIAKGSKVAFRFTGRGTFKNEFLATLPTGQQVVHAGVAIYRFENGKLVEDWASKIQVQGHTIRGHDDRESIEDASGGRIRAAMSSEDGEGKTPDRISSAARVRGAKG
jgi:hypothetical protein